MYKKNVIDNFCVIVLFVICLLIACAISDEHEEHTRLVASLDFDSDDSVLLQKTAILVSDEDAEVEVLAFNEMVILNRVWTKDEFCNAIPAECERTIYELGFDPEILNEIQPTEKSFMAIQLILLEQWDETKCSTKFYGEKQ